MIDPRGLTVTQWTSAVTLTLSTLGALPALHHEDEWERWAYGALALPAVAKFSPPEPRGFSDWRSWAERFVECVQL